MNYYNDIKKELINNEIYRRVKDYSKNKNDLNTYYNVGKLLVEAQGGEKRAKYGDKIIKDFAFKLTIELKKIFFYLKKYETILFNISKRSDTVGPIKLEPLC